MTPNIVYSKVTFTKLIDVLSSFGKENGGAISVHLLRKALMMELAQQNT